MRKEPGERLQDLIFLRRFNSKKCHLWLFLEHLKIICPSWKLDDLIDDHVSIDSFNHFLSRGSEMPTSVLQGPACPTEKGSTPEESPTASSCNPTTILTRYLETQRCTPFSRNIQPPDILHGSTDVPIGFGWHLPAAGPPAENLQSGAQRSEPAPHTGTELLAFTHDSRIPNSAGPACELSQTKPKGGLEVQTTSTNHCKLKNTTAYSKTH